MPRFRSIGFMPETTYFMPSYTMDCVSTVAVVVPSPALSLVFDATSLTVCAPIFCSLFFSSISFATETPTLTKDGVSVAKEIELKNKLQNMGAQTVKEVASKTSDNAGDGTTTATVLTQSIVYEGMKYVVSGMN